MKQKTKQKQNLKKMHKKIINLISIDWKIADWTIPKFRPQIAWIDSKNHS